MTRTPLYLHLFHGRPKPGIDMDSWGIDGPVLLIYGIHVTYNYHIRVATDPLDPDAWYDVQTADNCLVYDDVLYGDWSVFAPGTDPQLAQRAEKLNHQKLSRRPTRST